MIVIIGVIISLSSSNLWAEEGADRMAVNYASSQFWNQYLAQPKVVDYPVVFIHGIARREEAWSKTARVMSGGQYYQMRYEKPGDIFHNYDGQIPNFWVWSLTYYTDQPILEAISGDLNLYAHRLEEMVGVIKRITGRDKVVLVAHSMGGLVARKYMVSSEENWASVHKILTVGTPNLGVEVSVGVVGQLKDVSWKSEFITDLNNQWQAMSSPPEKKWGVIGAVDLDIFTEVGPEATDSCGPGFVKLKTAIPYETRAAVENFGNPVKDTEHFGFRLAVEANHIGLLYKEATFQGINWAVQEK